MPAPSTSAAPRSRCPTPTRSSSPGRGETKRDLVRYYQAVAEPLLPTLQGRPLPLERYPNGASGKSFFQKRVPTSAPPWITTAQVATPNGTTSDYIDLSA